ncbi:uncharacterized protein PG986_014090 [Apiospora aurea]|uniref:Uncharacterized protein n=1 Tax=Apiospora aurea TaxID=335848 RepID=A0ABR1PS01_9PEZI
MRLAGIVVIFCMIITAAALPSKNNNNDIAASTRRHLHDPRHQHHLRGESSSVRSQVVGNVTGHTQIFCHNETQPPIYFTSQPDNGGPGVYLLNADPVRHGAVNGTMYLFYENDHDFVPYLWTVVCFLNPLLLSSTKILLLPPNPPGGAVFVTPCPTFEGRIVRGDVSNFDGRKHLLGTWGELSWSTNGTAWGDVSLLEGNDGPVLVQALDAANKYKGFSIDVLSNAPAGAWAQKLGTGSWCLDKITSEGGNSVTRAWETQFLDPNSVYLEDNINPVINSINGRFAVTFYAGVV